VTLLRRHFAQLDYKQAELFDSDTDLNDTSDSEEESESESDIACKRAVAKQMGCAMPATLEQQTMTGAAARSGRDVEGDGGDDEERNVEPSRPQEMRPKPQEAGGGIMVGEEEQGVGSPQILPLRAKRQAGGGATVGDEEQDVAKPAQILPLRPKPQTGRGTRSRHEQLTLGSAQVLPLRPSPSCCSSKQCD